MSQRSGVPLGVCILPAPRKNVGRAVLCPHYIHEVLGHAGVCYDEIALEEIEASLPSLRVLVTVGEAALSEEQQAALRIWMEAGGAWLSVGGVCGMEESFGVQVEPPTYVSWGGGVCNLGEGYLVAEASLFGEATEFASLPLHFFGGLAVRRTTGEVHARILNAHQQPTERVGVADQRVGQGFCRLIAVDIPGTLVRIQQGIAVTRDGVAASDGTAPISDGVLKSDDGCVLDWIFDRQPLPGVPGLSVFLHPIADLWRELFLRSLFALAEATGTALPLLWLYPNNLPAIGHISHDSDGNTLPEAQQLLETLKAAEIHSTWCIIEPGYPPDLMRAIRDAGHELSMHYDAVSEGRPWSEEEFARQWEFLVALFEGERPVSNKNHVLRWEGDTEFYRWCERYGIQLDQTKGTSKTGGAGFNFGTCHPFFPIDPEGKAHDVLELPTPTQDLSVFAPQPLLEPVLTATLRHHGVLHLLFHPAHIFKPDVAETIKRAVAKAKAEGMEWWTAAQINRWERARRTARWRDYQASAAGVSVTLETPEPLPGAVVLWLLPGDAQTQTSRTLRWEHHFHVVPLSESENRTHEVRAPWGSP